MEIHCFMTLALLNIVLGEGEVGDNQGKHGWKMWGKIWEWDQSIKRERTEQKWMGMNSEAGFCPHGLWCQWW